MIWPAYLCRTRFSSSSAREVGGGGRLGQHLVADHESRAEDAQSVGAAVVQHAQDEAAGVIKIVGGAEAEIPGVGRETIRASELRITHRILIPFNFLSLVNVNISLFSKLLSDWFV